MQGALKKAHEQVLHKSLIGDELAYKRVNMSHAKALKA